MMNAKIIRATNNMLKEMTEDSIASRNNGGLCDILTLF